MMRYFITIGFLFLFLMEMAGTPNEINHITHASDREILFFSDFNPDEDFAGKWAIINANDDAITWEHRPPVHGPDNTGGIASCGTNGSLQTDDYLMTKEPVSLSKGGNYITFHFRAVSLFCTEDLRLLYGKTSDPKQMTEILFEEEGFSHQLYWRFVSCNFDIADAGDYYFAFHAYSQPSKGGVWLDNVTIGTGSYTGSVDFTVSKIVLPASACGLTADTKISCTVTNTGTADSENFGLRFLSNGEVITTVNFDEKVYAGEQKEVSLGNIADFSAMKRYDVAMISICEADNNPDNDTTYASVTHYTPVPTEELPRHHVFTSAGRIYADEWLMENINDWILQSVGWRANYINKPLRSRCFNFTPGKYRIEITYQAGNDFYLKSDDFQILMGPTGTDISSWSVVREFTNEITDKKTGTASFVITEEGTYTFALMSTKLSSLWIHDFLIKLGFDNDISLENGKMHSSPYSIYTTIPVEHLKTEYDFSGTIVNNGVKNATNAKLSIIGKNDVVLTNSETKTLAPRETYDIAMKSHLTGFEAGETASIKIKASMNETDEFSDDNIFLTQFSVSDSILAIDNGDISMSGVTIRHAMGYGSLFQFLTTDTLTSISIGWGENTSNASDFFLSLYSVEYPSGRLNKTFFTIPATRPESAIVANYPVPNFVLPPDYYYIELKQADETPLNIAADYGPGFIFGTSSNPPGYLSAAEYGVGFFVLRPCFGHHGNVVSKDAKVVSIDEPTTTEGLYAVNEKVTVTIENNGADEIDRLEVRCTVNSNEPVIRYIEQMQAYTEYSVTFEADISAPGENIVTVSTHLEGDENTDNDVVTKTYRQMEPINPYKLDFESCQDFANSNFNPAWTTYDGDGSPTVEFTSTFPNMQKSIGFMAFNPSKTTPASTSTYTYPYEGDKFGASIRTESGQRNDWLISPQLLLGDESKFSFYAKSNSPSQNLELFNVLVSITDNKPASFHKLGETYTTPTEWTAYTFDLSAYDNQLIHVAIQCVSESGLIFMIDNIEITFAPVSIASVDLDNALVIYPNPVHETLQVNCSVPIEEVFISDIMGKTIFQYTPKNYNGQYRINVGHFPHGIYLLNVRSAGQVASRKFIVN